MAFIEDSSCLLPQSYCFDKFVCKKSTFADLFTLNIKSESLQFGNQLCKEVAEHKYKC